MIALLQTLLFCAGVYQINSIQQLQDAPSKQLNPPTCLQTSEENSYRCLHYDSLLQLSNDLPADVIKLEIVDGNFTLFNSAYLNKFKQLVEVTFSNSYIKNWEDKWSDQLQNLKIVTFNASTIEDSILKFKPEVMGNLNLDKLIFINNSLVMNESDLSFAKQVVIEGGSFYCHNNNLWVYEMIINGTASVSNHTTCVAMDLDTWHPLNVYNGKLFLQWLKANYRSKSTCPSKCECTVTTEKYYNYVICKDKNITSFPAISLDTTYLNLSHNKITNFDEVFSNQNYNQNMTLILNHNNIETFDGSQYARYITNKSHYGIWLSHNNLTHFPSIEVRRAFESVSKYSTFTFKLGDNPWDCGDCAFIVDFQKLLLDYPRNFDIDRIHCKEKLYTNDGSFKQNVFGMDFSKTCAKTRIHPLDIVIVVLGVLNCVAIGFIFYSYHQYKKHNRLPFQGCQKCLKCPWTRLCSREFLSDLWQFDQFSSFNYQKKKLIN